MAGFGDRAYPARIAKKSFASGATLINLKVGKSGSASTHDFGGDLAEVLLFSAKLSSTDEEKIEGYLAHKWGIASTLPELHTYRQVPPNFDNSPKITDQSYTTEVGAAASPQITRKSDLLAWWKMDDASGSTLADASGNGRTATLSGDPTLGATGVLGSAITLDGTGDYATVSGIELNNRSFSVTFWVLRPNEDPGLCNWAQ
jgi:hypothetical protein